ncbi:monooxygenase [Macrophomina phaseolina]|nr:monooxygenase [Macrophomina phaseolina]
MDQQPVLIVGAGLVGLALGQALKRASIPFRIFERDASLTTRGQGWAITLHWSLSFLDQLLDPQVLQRVEAVQVDPENAANDQGNFLFLDLRDCSVKFKIPPSPRWRVNRERMRAALFEGLEEHVVWGRRVVGVKPGPELVFEDGVVVAGRLVVGVDGSRSKVRELLAPETYRNRELPIRFTGVAIDMTPEQIKPLRDLDPLLFQGLHPESKTYMWYSTLETPAVNGTEGTGKERYRVQLNMSWPVEKSEDEVARTDADRLKFMKERARKFDQRLRRVWVEIPEDTEVTEVKLADWECLEWDNRNCQVTLAGDAAHAMTMYRGEAANHGLLDAMLLVNALKRSNSGEKCQKEAIEEYEREMRERTGPAVLMSRQACYDAHAWENLKEDCAILKRRAIKSLH